MATHYEQHMFPMVPAWWWNDTATFDEYGTPYIGCDFRPMINCEFTIPNQWGVQYDTMDLEDALNGLDNAIHGEKRRQLKELQAHKDLLDQIAFMIKTGEMTQQDLVDTQETVHKSLSDANNPYYKSFDISRLPQSFFTHPQTGLFRKNNSLITCLRQKYRVWYICHHKDRVVIIGDDLNQVSECIDELVTELQAAAGGKWIDIENQTTKRFEKAIYYTDQELDNCDLITKTWGKPYRETWAILKKEGEEYMVEENVLRAFALHEFDSTLSNSF
jgi:hypothetical protein